MKIYFAGVKRAYLPDLSEEDSILVSFAYKDELDLIGKIPNEILVDSGAFTFWRSGREIDYPANISLYCDFIKEKQITNCIAMDVIGGNSKDQLNNIQMMVDKGVSHMWPVFHEGDDFDLLHEYYKMGFKKICIAGTVSRGKSSLIDWIYKVFNSLSPNDVKYHGLAMTQQYIFENMKDYFDSVDSTTWLSLAKYGLKGAGHLLHGRNIDFYRKTGRLAMLDMLSGQSEKRSQLSDQLSFLDLLT